MKLSPASRERARFYAAAAAAAAAIAAVLFATLYGVPRAVVSGTLTSAERLKAENDVRTTLIQLLGGAVLSGGLYFTARTLQLNREGQVTDRFSKAIEQLGSGNLDVRLGGIYALERIARDSSRDHEPIVEILCAFLREHADKSGAAPLDILKGPSSDRSPADVTAALEVLGRRTARSERRSLDLRRIRVKGAHLEGANLRGALLNGVELTYANLQRADLSGAKLSDADLRCSDCRGADLSNAMLDDAKLTSVKWEQARVSGVFLNGASYDRDQFTGEQLAAAIEGD